MIKKKKVSVLSNLQTNLFKIHHPTIGPTYRKQAVNPWHQTPQVELVTQTESHGYRLNLIFSWNFRNFLEQKQKVCNCTHPAINTQWKLKIFIQVRAVKCYIKPQKNAPPQKKKKKKIPESARMCSNSHPPSYSHKFMVHHYNDVIMSVVASQIPSLTIVYSTVYSCPDQRKHQSSASLAFVKGIPHTKGQ